MVTQFLEPFFRYKFLLFQLTQRDIKARYKQSFVGYTWILFHPLAQLAVYSFVFSQVIRFPTGDIPYPIFLFVALLPWTFFQTAIMTGTMSLVDNSPLLRKIAFPREVIPYAAISAKLVDLFFSSLVLLCFLLWFGLGLAPSMLLAFPLLLIQMMLMTGITLIVSAANLFYRDIQYLMNLLLLLWMYISPIFYPVSLVPAQYQQWYLLNPLVGIFEGYRAAFFGTPLPLVHTLYSAVFSCAVFVIGYIFFKKAEKSFADVA